MSRPRIHGAKLCSIIRVLVALIEHGDWVSLTRLARLSGLYYTTARDAVEYLVRVGLVEERVDGRTRLFKAVGNPTIREVLEKLEGLGD